MAETLRGFAGFPAGRTRFTRIPNEFFSDVVPLVDDVAELKVLLYTFWRLDQGEGETRYLRLDDVLVDLLFLDGMGAEPEEQRQATVEAFERTAQRGVLIALTVKKGDKEELWYFLNSARGRDAVSRIKHGDFEGLIHDIDDVVVGLERERPNIFLLYEQNIGVLTPMIADKLRQAERDYPDDWIFDAIGLAVERNKRSWAYIASILMEWAEHGKDIPSQISRPLTASAIGDPDSADIYDDNIIE